MPVLQVKGLDTDALQITHIQVNQAQKQRRRTYRAHGRINRECRQQHPAVHAAVAPALVTSLHLHSSCGMTLPCTDSCCSKMLLAHVASACGLHAPWCVLLMGSPCASGARAQHGCMASVIPVRCPRQESTTLHSCSASRACLT